MDEPVNERPMFPSPVRDDSLGFSIWSGDMVRQLTTVFQQYGYRLNQALTESRLDANGGTIPETDRVNDFDSMMLVAGDPIVESGSNSVGRWTRFATGLQIITMDVNVDFTVLVNPLPYPVPFVGPPPVASVSFGNTSTATRDSISRSFLRTSGSSTLSQGAFMVYDANPSASTSYTIHVTVVGYWK
jgi:hypothetical protein